MVLHTLSASPRSRAFDDCLALAGPDDTIVLLGDGVYAALPGDALARLRLHPARICLLADDAAALGVTGADADMAAIDMAGFVALTETCPRQLAWF